MSSEQSACRRRPAESNGSKGASERGGTISKAKNVIQKMKKEEGGTTTTSSGDKRNASPNATATCAEDSPNYLVYKKVRKIINGQIDWAQSFDRSIENQNAKNVCCSEKKNKRYRFEKRGW